MQLVSEHYTFSTAFGPNYILLLVYCDLLYLLEKVT